MAVALAVVAAAVAIVVEARGQWVFLAQANSPSKGRFDLRFNAYEMSPIAP